MEELKNIIRDIPDFPKKGIVFKDITTLLSDARSFHRMIDLIAHRYVGNRMLWIVFLLQRQDLTVSIIAVVVVASVVVVVVVTVGVLLVVAVLLLHCCWLLVSQVLLA